jgi:hypothetical protein
MTTAAPSWTNAVGAIAGVAIDQLHDLAIEQVEQLTTTVRDCLHRHERVEAGAESESLPAPFAQAHAAPAKPPMTMAKAAPVIIGALLGVGVAMAIEAKSKKRG